MNSDERPMAMQSDSIAQMRRMKIRIVVCINNGRFYLSGCLLFCCVFLEVS